MTPCGLLPPLAESVTSDDLLAVIMDAGPCTAMELAVITGTTRESVHRKLRSLRSWGLAEVIGLADREDRVHEYVWDATGRAREMDGRAERTEKRDALRERAWKVLYRHL